MVHDELDHTLSVVLSIAAGLVAFAMLSAIGFAIFGLDATPANFAILALFAVMLSVLSSLFLRWKANRAWASPPRKNSGPFPPKHVDVTAVSHATDTPKHGLTVAPTTQGIGTAA